jgi:hypothetical protein
MDEKYQDEAADEVAREMMALPVVFGRGLIKVVIAVLVGVGVGFIVFGATALDKPDIWRRRDPPADMFLGIGAGLLSGGGVMLGLFAPAWLRRRPKPPELPRRAPWEDKRP